MLAWDWLMGTPLFIYCVDVWINIEWELRMGSPEPFRRTDDWFGNAGLGIQIGQDLPSGRVALGVECSLFVPLRTESLDLLRCRPGEDGRNPVLMGTRRVPDHQNAIRPLMYRTSEMNSPLGAVISNC
jgi:hypothetical protein